MRKLFWSRSDWLSLPEDKRIGELQRFCTRLYGGDRNAGETLVVDAIYRDARTQAQVAGIARNLSPPTEAIQLHKLGQAQARLAKRSTKGRTCAVIQPPGARSDFARFLGGGPFHRRQIWPSVLFRFSR